MNWIALFSHTGNEIQQLSDRLGVKPDKVITNQDPNNNDINKRLLKEQNMYYTRNKPTSSDYNRMFSRGDFVTLHGWMRIIPEDVCNEAEIYNLHPGLITQYPELKGADPQDRVFSGDMEYADVGCVLHKVTPVVDDGEVVMEVSTFNHYYEASTLSTRLHQMANDMWYDFLSYRLKGESNSSFKA